MQQLTSTQAYFLFAAFRVLNALLLIQSQFDPDEYWQNLEPAYCQVFFGGGGRGDRGGKPCAGLTWEWKRRSSLTNNNVESLNDFIQVGLEGPVRSYVSILPTMAIYYLLKTLALDSTFLVSKGPILLNAVLVTAPTDWAVWWMSRWMELSSSSTTTTTTSDKKIEEKGPLAGWCSFCSITSWFWAYAFVRPYSNSLEAVILAMSLALVAKELIGCQLNNNDKSRMYRARVAFLLGGLCCSIRFTCLAAYIPMGIVLALQEGSVFTKAFSTYIFSVCALPGLFGILVTLLVDRLFYGFWAIPFLGNIHFNVILGNGSLYGTHPSHWYLTAGIPAITGVMLPFLILCLFVKPTTGERNLWSICLCYITAHSVSGHKEFRFMLPLLPVFCLISGKRMREVAWRRRRRKGWMITVAVVNLFVVMYLGLIHQRGVVDVNLKIVDLVQHEPQTYTIHYLLGCHSTPLLSHLHTPPVQFETWTLDCGPDCRANPNVICESERFENNVEEFTEEHYFHCSDFEEGTCVTDLRLFYPDFVVTRSSYLPKLSSRFATMGMEKVARFTNGIDGVQLPGNTIVGSESCLGGQSTKIQAPFDIGFLCVDEIVLFKNRNTKPRY